MAKESNLKLKIYTAIFESIIKGEYGAGDILSEKMLTEKYGVSKSPVREALVELCNEGILKSMPRYGYEIVKLTREDIENILKFRLILEGGSLRDNMTTISESQIKKLEELDALCTNEEALGDFWIHWGHNKDFHLGLISFSNNRFAYDMLKKSLDTLTRAYAQFYWDKWHLISYPMDTKAHAKIIECIIKKDAEGAIHFLREDIADFGM